MPGKSKPRKPKTQSLRKKRDVEGNFILVGEREVHVSQMHSVIDALHKFVESPGTYTSVVLSDGKSMFGGKNLTPEEAE